MPRNCVAAYTLFVSAGSTASPAALMVPPNGNLLVHADSSAGTCVWTDSCAVDWPPEFCALMVTVLLCAAVGDPTRMPFDIKVTLAGSVPESTVQVAAPPPVAESASI